jgi:hypothetical protein
VIVTEGRFDREGFREELQTAPENRAVGTDLWFENDRVRVWDLHLEPGQRAPFHCHAEDYFWTVVSPGRGRQRFADGTYQEREYSLGETRFLHNSLDSVLIHDLENVGQTVLRFVTVELKQS